MSSFILILDMKGTLTSVCMRRGRILGYNPKKSVAYQVLKWRFTVSMTEKSQLILLIEVSSPDVQKAYYMVGDRSGELSPCKVAAKSFCDQLMQWVIVYAFFRTSWFSPKSSELTQIENSELTTPVHKLLNLLFSTKAMTKVIQM